MDIFEARKMAAKMQALTEEFPGSKVETRDESVILLCGLDDQGKKTYIKWISLDNRRTIGYVKTFHAKRAGDFDATEFISFDEAVHYFRTGEVFPL